MIHCGTMVKCNNAEGCFGCEYEEEQDFVCSYCGEDKRENKDKHIAEVAGFLQKEITKLKGLIK